MKNNEKTAQVLPTIPDTIITNRRTNGENKHPVAVFYTHRHMRENGLMLLIKPFFSL